MNDKWSEIANVGFASEVDFSEANIEATKQSRLSSGKSLINLASANPTEANLLFPPKILSKAFSDYFASRHYSPEPRGLTQARDTLSAYYTVKRKWHGVSAQNFWLTASTSEAYHFLFSLLANTGDEFLVPSPSYPLFEWLAKDSRVNPVPYYLYEENNWQIDPSQVKKLIGPRTRGIVVVSPHNPLGVIAHQDILALSSLEIPVILDEVFIEFSPGYGTTEERGLVPLSQIECPLFVLNGISKMFALPDLKLGWILANESACAIWGDRLDLLSDTFLNTSFPIQHALPTIFQKGSVITAAICNRIAHNLRLVQEVLQHSSLDCKVWTPEGGWGLIIKLPQGIDDEKCALNLLEEGVYVQPGFFYDLPANADYIVLSLLTEPHTLQEGLKIISTTISNIYQKTR